MFYWYYLYLNPPGKKCRDNMYVTTRGIARRAPSQLLHMQDIDQRVIVCHAGFSIPKGSMYSYMMDALWPESVFPSGNFV